MFILSNGRALFGFRLQFLKGTGVAESVMRRDKVLLYAKNFDKYDEGNEMPVWGNGMNGGHPSHGLLACATKWYE